MVNPDCKDDPAVVPLDHAPSFRVWPPVGVGAPWLLGYLGERVTGSSMRLGTLAEVAGWVLLAAFVVWNGWCLALFAQRRTGLLPGQGTSALLDVGPYRVSRNPLYLGMLALYVGTGLLASSWAVIVLSPLAWSALQWGAVLPEERYLAARLGSDYAEYRRRVPRWL